MGDPLKEARQYVVADVAPRFIASKMAELPGEADWAMVLLKGHLLVEESLNKQLEALLPDATQVLNNRTRFCHKLALFKALVPAPQPQGLWDCVGKLNTIRNGLAHGKKSHEELQGKFERLVEKMDEAGEYMPACDGKEGLDRMRFYLAVLALWVSTLDIEGRPILGRR